MWAIITGDIINSRTIDAQQWMDKLKETLNSFGKEPIDWEVYRGDSFQLRAPASDSLLIALLLKATIRQFKELDIRQAIGIGEITYEAKRITESNGSAFIRSGECFETLKKETIALSSPWSDFDRVINTMLPLAALTMDNWTPTSSETIKKSLENPEMRQTDLAISLDKSQSNVSADLKRGGYDEIQKMVQYFNQEITTRCSR
jgi:SatD family (SatD)